MDEINNSGPNHGELFTIFTTPPPPTLSFPESRHQIITELELILKKNWDCLQ